MAHKLPSGKWRVRWDDNGDSKSKIFPNKDFATRFDAQLKLSLAARQNPELVEKPNLIFADFSQQWLENYCRIEKAKSQWVGDESVIRIHLLPAFGGRDIKDLKKIDLLNLRQDLHKKRTPGKVGQPLKPKSINNILALAKKMLATAVDWELIPNNPFFDVKPVRKVEQTFDYWKPSERNSFLVGCEKIDPEFHRAVLLACHTGLRLGELAGLKWSSIDFQRKMLTVKESFNYRINSEIPHTKNGDIAHMPMNQLVCKVLLELKTNAQGPSVFPRELLQAANHRLRRRCRSLGIREIRFHDLRHTFASCLAMAGVDLMVIKELMRHKTYQMTLRYAHLHPDHLRGKTEVLCEFDERRGSDLIHENKANFSPDPDFIHETENSPTPQFSARINPQKSVKYSVPGP